MRTLRKRKNRFLNAVNRMFITDTHSFLWFLAKDKKISKKVLEIFRACDAGKEVVVVPSIVLLECLRICERKRVELEFQEIMRKIQGSSNYPIYPLDEDLILKCQNISQIPELHDRVIVATARLLNAPLITKDAKIIDSKVVETIW